MFLLVVTEFFSSSRSPFKAEDQRREKVREAEVMPMISVIPTRTSSTVLVMKSSEPITVMLSRIVMSTDSSSEGIFDIHFHTS